MAETQPTSFSISPDAKRLLTHLADRMGLSRSKIVEVALRELAMHWGIKDVRSRSRTKKVRTR